MKRYHYVFYIVLLLLLCCKKPFTLPVTSSANSYLVVEGVINSANDSTIIKLSRTVNISNKITTNAVTAATVMVESDHNDTYILTESKHKGWYVTATLNLPVTQNYRLRIKTADGKEYLSDLMAVKYNPPIDSVGYNLQNSNVNVYVNTHNAANATRYYRWDYTETWNFHARYQSSYIADTRTNTVVPRTPGQQVYYCYANDTSSVINLKSTTSLSSDVVYQHSLTLIPLSSEKVEIKYSILVNQYALTEEAFNFYQNLKKNTEQLGSIFDAQPSQLGGNIHCISNPNEPVIGYITITNVQSKRIFISNSDLPNQVTSYPYTCEQDSALFSNKQGINEVKIALIDAPGIYLATSTIPGQGAGIAGYLYTTAACADCTLRGYTQAPSFWR